MAFTRGNRSNACQKMDLAAACGLCFALFIFIRGIICDDVSAAAATPDTAAVDGDLQACSAYQPVVLIHRPRNG